MVNIEKTGSNSEGVRVMEKNNKMTTCRYCGAEIAKSAKTCPHCGGKNKKPFYKKWWFWLLALLILAGAGSERNQSSGRTASVGNQQSAIRPAPQTAETIAVQETAARTAQKAVSSSGSKQTESFQSILTQYSDKIRAATPGLIEEYKRDVRNNTGGITGLAEICNEKVMKLAAIETEGTEKMAALYLQSGSGSYDDYMEWAAKLYSVYEEEAQKIYGEYMKSVM